MTSNGNSTREIPCDRCGIPLKGRFCANCGAEQGQAKAAGEAADAGSDDPEAAVAAATAAAAAPDAEQDNETAAMPIATAPQEQAVEPLAPDADSRSRAWLWWLLGLAAAVGVIALGWTLGVTARETPSTTTTSTSTTTTSTTSTTTTPLVDPEVALRQQASELGDVQKSEVVETSTETFGIVAITEENDDFLDVDNGTLRLYSYSGDTWIASHVFEFGQPVYDWTSADLTGDSEPDILLNLLGSIHSTSAVLTKDGAPDWRVAEFEEPGAEGLSTPIIDGTTVEELIEVYTWIVDVFYPNPGFD